MTPTSHSQHCLDVYRDSEDKEGLHLPAETLVPKSNSAQSLSSDLRRAWLCLCHTQHAHISNRSRDPAHREILCCILSSGKWMLTRQTSMTCWTQVNNSLPWIQVWIQVCTNCSSSEQIRDRWDATISLITNTNSRNVKHSQLVPTGQQLTIRCPKFAHLHTTHYLQSQCTKRSLKQVMVKAMVSPETCHKQSSKRL